jgi:uncharacterized protein YgiM (DUF1202 family)
MKTGRTILGLLVIGIIGSAIFGERSEAPPAGTSSEVKGTAAPQQDTVPAVTEVAVRAEPEVRPAAMPTAKTVRVEASSLRMRSEPSLEGAVVAAYARGTEMALQAKEGDWYQVTAPDGATGWMHASYLAELPAGQTESEGGPGSAAERGRDDSF